MQTLGSDWPLAKPASLPAKLKSTSQTPALTGPASGNDLSGGSRGERGVCGDGDAARSASLQQLVRVAVSHCCHVANSVRHNSRQTGLIFRDCCWFCLFCLALINRARYPTAVRISAQTLDPRSPEQLPDLSDDSTDSACSHCDLLWGSVCIIHHRCLADTCG